MKDSDDDKQKNRGCGIANPDGQGFRAEVCQAVVASQLREEVRNEYAETVVGRMQEDGGPQRAGPVVHPSKKDPHQEGREGLPRVEVNDGKDECGPEDGSGRGGVSEQTAQDQAPAEKLFQERCQNGDAQQVDPQVAAGHFLHELVEPLRCRQPGNQAFGQQGQAGNGEQQQ